ncbi:hypothetical protein ScalyP_jg5907 [Parmales sp. scaly parma]|nr:hypothetical protein ScalyP_jg5907 [Parmales sp. scaly parma]
MLASFRFCNLLLLSIASSSFHEANKNALAACDQRGSLVIAVECPTSKSIVVGRISRQKNPGSLVRHLPSQLSPLFLSDDLNSDRNCHVLLSGFAPDGVHLVNRLRQHVRNEWIKYDTCPDVVKIADCLASSGMLGLSTLDVNDELLGESDLYSRGRGRPLGVRVLLLQNCGGIYEVNPSGGVTKWRAKAIGQLSRRANELLNEKYNPDSITTTLAKELCTSVFEDILSDSQEEVKVIFDVLDQI